MHPIFPSDEVSLQADKRELQGNFTAISKQVYKTFQENYCNLLNM